MKSNIFSIIALGSLLLATGCDEKWEPAGEGEGRMSLKNVTVENAEKLVTTDASRADIDLTPFLVNIYEQGVELPVRSYEYGTMPEIVTLPVGDYTVEVESHKVQKAEWEKPYFTGSTAFSIENGKIKDVDEVVCRFASLKVTVAFADDLRPLLGNDVKVVVSSNDAGELEYTPDETRAGYFEVVDGSMTMIAHFEGTVDGAKTVYETTFTDIAAGQHRKITFKTKPNPTIPDPTGNINPGSGISIDTSIINEDIAGNAETEEDVINSDDRPGKEDPKEPENPVDPIQPDDPSTPVATFTTTNPNFKLDAVNTATEDFGDAIISIHCDEGFAHLLLTITSSNAGFISAISDFGLDKPDIDLAYPGDLEDALHNSLFLPVGDEIIGQNDVDFNITTFIPLLLGFPGDHQFKLVVENTKGKSEILDLKFKVD